MAIRIIKKARIHKSSSPINKGNKKRVAHYTGNKKGIRKAYKRKK